MKVNLNTTSFNTNIQTTTAGSESQLMSHNFSIHQIVIDENKRTVFTPNQLSAIIDDIILFTSMSLNDEVAQISSDQSCHMNNSLSAINFSR